MVSLSVVLLMVDDARQIGVTSRVIKNILLQKLKLAVTTTRGSLNCPNNHGIGGHSL